MKKYAYVGLAAAAVFAVIGLAGGVSADKESGVAATVTGQNFCLECSLREGGGKCSVESCQHALKVTEATDSSGKPIEELKGETLHYLISDASKPLNADEAMWGKTVTIEGTVFEKEHAIEVAKVEVKEGEPAAAAEEQKEAKSGGDAAGGVGAFDDFDFSKGGGSASKRR